MMTRSLIRRKAFDGFGTGLETGKTGILAEKKPINQTLFAITPYDPAAVCR
jgi:hypothetical protein